MRDRNVRRTKRSGVWPLTLAALGTFLWVGASASPARADSNFERGFEDQMGRIMAYEAVNLGKAILFQGVVHGGSGHGQAYDYGHTVQPTVYTYRPAVPVHTHEHGKRPVRWSGYDQHPGKHLGHHKHDRHDRRDRYDRHDRRDHRHDRRDHRHDRDCRH